MKHELRLCRRTARYCDISDIKNGYCVTAQRLAGLRRTDSED